MAGTTQYGGGGSSLPAPTNPGDILTLDTGLNPKWLPGAVGVSVDYVHPSGVDAPGYGSILKPYKTIFYAEQNGANSSVYVLSGTHTVSNSDTIGIFNKTIVFEKGCIVNCNNNSSAVFSKNTNSAPILGEAIFNLFGLAPFVENRNPVTDGSLIVQAKQVNIGSVPPLEIGNNSRTQIENCTFTASNINISNFNISAAGVSFVRCNFFGTYIQQQNGNSNFDTVIRHCNFFGNSIVNNYINLSLFGGAVARRAIIQDCSFDMLTCIGSAIIAQPSNYNPSQACFALTNVYFNRGSAIGTRYSVATSGQFFTISMINVFDSQGLQIGITNPITNGYTYYDISAINNWIPANYNN